MIDVQIRVYLLPNGVGKGRLAIFRQACEKFSLEYQEYFQTETTDFVIVEDTLDPQVVIEKILHLNPSNSNLPTLISTRWLSESLRAQKLLNHESYIRSLMIEREPITEPTTTATATSNTLSPQKTNKLKSHTEPLILPRLRPDSDSDYEDDEEKLEPNPDLVVSRSQLTSQSFSQILSYLSDFGLKRNHFCRWFHIHIIQNQAIVLLFLRKTTGYVATHLRNQ